MNYRDINTVSVNAGLILFVLVYLSVGQVNYPKVFEEDSSDALSPEQPASQESQSSVPSPGESKAPETPSPATALPPQPSTMLQVK